MNFPTKIPVSIPWTSSEWMPMTVGQVIEDDAFFDFIESWKRELHGSGREQQYLAFISQQSGCRESDKVSAHAVRRILQAAMKAVADDKTAPLSPAAAFELLATVEFFTDVALQSLPKTAERNLFTEITGIKGFVPIYAFHAVSHHFRSGTQLAGN